MLKVVKIVAGHGLNDGPESHRAALRMSRRAMTIGLGQRADQMQIPVACSAKKIERREKIIGSVVSRPGILIEWLNNGMGLTRRGCERLAKTKRKSQFAVGKVRDDLADAPLAGAGCCSICSAESGAVRVRSRSAVAKRTGIGPGLPDF